MYEPIQYHMNEQWDVKDNQMLKHIEILFFALTSNESFCEWADSMKIPPVLYDTEKIECELQKSEH